MPMLGAQGLMAMNRTILLLAMFLGGCDVQYRALTSEFRDTYAATAEDQLAVNLARAAANPYAIPNQLQIGGSTATVTGTTSLNAWPGIAFRGIAVTGVGLSGGSTMSQQMAVAPVNNHIDLRQLQLLLAHLLPDRDGRGLRPCNQAVRNTDTLEDALWRAAFPVQTPRRPPGLPLSGTLGPLPDGCLVLVEPADSCADNRTRTTVSGSTICFRGDAIPVGGASVSHSAEALRSLLALWTVAIPLVDYEAMAELAAQAARARARRTGRPSGAPAPAARALQGQAPISQRRLTPQVFPIAPAPPQ
jgi:hypothetical protein